MTIEDIARKIAEYGELVEIFAPGADSVKWDTLLRTALLLGYQGKLERAGIAIPFRIEPSMFADSFDAGYTLTLRKGGQIWTSTLFEESVIDLQCESEMIATAGGLREVGRLMGAIREITGRRVDLIAETVHPESVIPFMSIG
ncbi:MULTISPECIES: hypothetical protein [unclassified Nocardia]|uniref:hypothetical protein n=1 Tax=unclassified Nocardia TaxID=2637762 RepID=UPI001CE4537F|nr:MULTISPECIES: hypothetical protein [unclassified Nocardia]